MKNKIKQVTSLLLCMGMIVSQISYTPVHAVESIDTEEATVSIYPTPQSVEQNSTEGMKLEGTVDILVHGEQDEATLLKLKTLLDEKGIAYQEVSQLGDNAAIVIAVLCDDENCDICKSVTDNENALTKEQGYVLKSSNDTHKNGLVTIVGADSDGAYYGVMSLIQMFDQKTSDGRIAEVTVSDYPDLKLRGYVEGFYGYPWTWEDRANLFEETSKYKMTTYIYGPKDDPYHHSSWRTLYPEEEAEKLKDVVATANANNMDFCWAIHPGGNYNYTKDSDGDGIVDDFNNLIAKFEQVYSLGVRQFGIFYDDLSESKANATNHYSVINAAYEYMTEKYDDVKPFITVVTKYNNTRGASWDYFNTFYQNVKEDVIVLWTGETTMSSITQEIMEVPKTQSGVDRDLGVWWNYPVNDYLQTNRYASRLLMAPLYNLSTEVNNINSFFLNPMSESDASKVAIFSGADYSWNISDFDSNASWERAIEELVPEASEEFKRFADNISYVTWGYEFTFDESVYLKEDIQNFENALKNGEDISDEVRVLKEKFKQMDSDVEVLKAINNKNLLAEINDHLKVYNSIAEAGIAAMEGFEYALNNNLEKSLASIALLSDKLEESKVYITSFRGDTIQVVCCIYRILPLLESCEEKIINVLENSNYGSNVNDGKLLTNLEELEDLSIVSTLSTYSVENITTTMNKDDYVAIALPKTANIKEISATVTPTENFKLQYSLNGIEWLDIDSTTSDTTLTSDHIVTATYARVICTADNTDAKIAKFSVQKAYSTMEPSISTNQPTYENYVIENAIDGDLSTKFYASKKAFKDDYIAVDLKENVKLNSVTLYTGVAKTSKTAGYGNTQLEISLDGNTWTAVGEPLPIEDYVEIESSTRKLTIGVGGVEARYFRIRSSDNTSKEWTELLEIQYNVDLDVSTSLSVYQDYIPENAIDGSFDTWAWIKSDRGGPRSEVGDYVQLDLGDLVPLYDANIYFGLNKSGKVDGFKATKLQTSIDGETWVDVSDPISLDDYENVDGLYKVSFASDGSLVRYIRFVATEDNTEWTKVYEIEYNTEVGYYSLIDTNNLSLDVTTSLSVYQDYTPEKAIDGSYGTWAWIKSDRGGSRSEVGDYVQLDFGKAIPLFDASIYFGRNKNGGVDGFKATKLQTSIDGETWVDAAGSISSDDYEVINGLYKASYTSDGSLARYIRFVATANYSSWTQVYEIEFNNSIDLNSVRFADEQEDAVVEFYPDSTYINNSTVNMNYSNYLDDGDIKSAPYMYQISEGDSLIYPMTTLTNVSTLSVLQEPNTISNAQVSVLKVDGTWVDVGTLNNTYTSIDINDTILAAKFTFDGSVEPIIYEIFTLAAADYTKVDEAIAKVPADLSVYTDETVTALNNAINGVVRGLDETKQAVVDGYATAIEEALAALEYKAADYTKVEEAKAKVPADLSVYTDETVAALNEALAYDATKNITEQAVVDGYAIAIEEAINNLVLKTADYTKVDEAIAKVPTDLTVYTQDSVKILQDALNAVVRDLDITKQTDVDAMALAIENALSGLVKVPGQVDTGDNAAIEVFVASTLLSVLAMICLKKKEEF